MTDIVDAIDQLIDHQLAAGPVDDYNTDRYDRCWHCKRHWHGLPITARIAAMYYLGHYDESYSAADDDTPILCQGSNFIGPMPSEDRWQQANRPRGYTRDDLTALRWTREPTREPGFTYTGFTIGYTLATQRRWWRLRLPANATITDNGETVTLTIGNTSHEFPLEDVHLRHEHETTPLPANAPPHVFASHWTDMDVLAETAPHIGGTWEPLTAPGVTTHPRTTEETRQLGQLLISDITDTHITAAQTVGPIVANTPTATILQNPEDYGFHHIGYLNEPIETHQEDR